MPAPAILGTSRRWSPRYLLYDEFITPDAAPLTSPRTCEPGPGTLAITDTASVLSISGGQLTKVPDATSPFMLEDPATFSAGTCIFAVPTLAAGSLTSQARIVLQTAAAANLVQAVDLSVATVRWGFRVGTGTTNMADPSATAGVQGTVGIIVSGSSFVFVFKIVGSVATLMAVFPITGTPGRWLFNATGPATDGAIVYARVGRLDLTIPINTSIAGTDWSDPYSLAIVKDTLTESAGVLLSAHTPEKGSTWVALLNNFVMDAGGYFIMSGGEARCAMETGASDVFIIGELQRTGGAPCVAFRVVDVDNQWWASRESTISALYEVTASVIVSRASVSVSNDSLVNQVSVRASGSDIRVYIRNNAGTYTVGPAYTSSIHQTATKHGVRANANSGARIHGFYCWPIDITNSLPEGL